MDKPQDKILYLLFISIIASLFVVFVFVYLLKNNLFFISSNVAGDTLKFFFDFIIYGIVFDPISYAIIYYLVKKYHEKNKDINKTIVYAFLREETKRDLIIFWGIDFICLILTFIPLSITIHIYAELYIFFLTPFLVFHSIFMFLATKNNLR